MAGAIPKQTQEDIVPPQPIAIGYRLGAVLLTAPVAVTLHLILTGPFGLNLQIPEAPGSSTLKALPLIETTRLVLIVSLLAWVTVIALERGLGAERGRAIWRWVALGVYVFSLLPIALIDVGVGERWGLVALHSIVALLLIPAMTAKGTPGDHPPTNVGEPASAGDIGDDAHDSGHHAGHDDDHVHAAPASDAHDDSAHDDSLDH